MSNHQHLIEIKKKKMENINDLATLLRQNGDKILDASSKLSLSATLLRKLNVSFSKLFKQSEDSFHVVSSSGDIIESFLDLQFVYEFLQKTIALKILPGTGNHSTIDLNVFRNLKLLEIHRFSLNLIQGIKSLRTQLQYLTCMRSLSALKEVLEWCGGDRSQGFVWCELKEAVFSHNGISNLDASLEFTPCLQILDLSHNRIQNAQPLNCLTHLECLNLSFNRLESLPNFSNNIAAKLQVLVLRNNYIEDIQELAVLSKLIELDLANNCLMDHKALGPLSSLPFLRCLILQGNPLSFHQQHRSVTARYLHLNTLSSGFVLDGVALNNAESRLVGSLHPSPAQLERSSSFNSTTTASTVIPAGRSLSKEHVRVVATAAEQNSGRSTCLQEEMIGMQDSGFVAEPRPASPSECSIGRLASEIISADLQANVFML